MKKMGDMLNIGYKSSNYCLRQRAHEANIQGIKIGKNRKNTQVKVEKQVNKSD